MLLDVASLLEKIGADAAGSLTEELRDVENAERAGTERSRQLSVCDVERPAGCYAEGL
jgi:hypothetical protein